MSVLTDVSNTVKTITEIANRIKSYELNQEINKLNATLLDLIAENARLKAELEEAKKTNDFADHIVLKDGMYWREGEDIPYCARCWDSEHKQIHMQKSLYVGYVCPEEAYRDKLKR
jgi:regulator of replication initiation timing